MRMKAKMGICELVYILQNAVDGLKEKEVHPADINEMIQFAYEYDETTETYIAKLTKEFVDDLFEYSRD